jgi:hypothetical protein
MKSSLVAGVLGSIILMKTNNIGSDRINNSIQDRVITQTEDNIQISIAEYTKLIQESERAKIRKEKITELEEDKKKLEFENQTLKSQKEILDSELTETNETIPKINTAIDKLREQVNNIFINNTGIIKEINAQVNEIGKKAGEVKVGVQDGDGNFVQNILGAFGKKNITTNNIKGDISGTKETITSLTADIEERQGEYLEQIEQLVKTVIQISKTLDAPVVGTTIGSFTVGTSLGGENAGLGLAALIAGLLKN